MVLTDHISARFASMDAELRLGMMAKGGLQTSIKRRHPGLDPGSMSLTLAMTPDPRANGCRVKPGMTARGRLLPVRFSLQMPAKQTIIHRS